MDSLAKKALKAAHRGMVWGRRIRVLSSQLGYLIEGSGPLDGIDVGAGSGEIAWNIKNMRPGLNIVGADILLRKDSRIDIVKFNGTKLPFADKSFDFSMLVDVLHHTEDPAVLLSECARVSRRFVLVKDHICETRWDNICLRFMDWFGNRGYGVNLSYNYLSKDKWETLFKAHNLACGNMICNLSIYPKPFSFLFDRKIHFIAKLEIKG